jgi:hypothetical protein
MIYLVAGPAGCGKKTFLQNKITTAAELHSFATQSWDCFEITEWNENKRKAWFAEIDYFASNVDTQSLFFWNIDELPRIWQRGFLTKMEKWNVTVPFIGFTARSLTRLDSAFKSRCIIHRLESRCKELAAASFSATDYTVLSSSSFSKEKVSRHVELIWETLFVKKEVDTCADFLKDFFLWGMTCREIVYYFIDFFEKQEKFNTDLPLMSFVISNALKNLKDGGGSWMDILNWLICIENRI